MQLYINTAVALELMLTITFLQQTMGRHHWYISRCREQISAQDQAATDWLRNALLQPVRVRCSGFSLGCVPQILHVSGRSDMPSSLQGLHGWFRHSSQSLPRAPFAAGALGAVTGASRDKMHRCSCACCDRGMELRSAQQPGSERRSGSGRAGHRAGCRGVVMRRDQWMSHA